MQAFLGLLSQPVEIERISADGIALRDKEEHKVGKAVVLELVSHSRSVVRLVTTQVMQVTPHPDGGYHVEGRFTWKLGDDELQALGS